MTTPLGPTGRRSSSTQARVSAAATRSWRRGRECGTELFDGEGGTGCGEGVGEEAGGVVVGVEYLDPIGQKSRWTGGQCRGQGLGRLRWARLYRHPCDRGADRCWRRWSYGDAADLRRHRALDVDFVGVIVGVVQCKRNTSPTRSAVRSVTVSGRLREGMRRPGACEPATRAIRSAEGAVRRHLSTRRWQGMSKNFIDL